MLTAKKVKQFLREQCEAVVSGIAPATPFSDIDKQRIAATLKIIGDANPAMSSPGVFDAEAFVDKAQSIIVFGRNSFFGTDRFSNNINPDPPRGAIGNFYLNEKMLNKAITHASLVEDFLSSHGFKAATPFIGFPQKLKALEAGIGFLGLHNLVINKQYGSWISLSTVITDAPLEPDPPFEGSCGKCKRCVEACPTAALSTPYTLQVERCIIFNLCHLKTEIPLQMREKIGVRVANCTLCSDVCPYNQSLAINEQDKLPEHIIYPELIPLMNMSEDLYEKRYCNKMFGFIMGERRYLRRNVAVALGNTGNKKVLPCLEQAAKDKDLLIRTHAEWAIEKIKGGRV